MTKITKMFYPKRFEGETDERQAERTAFYGLLNQIRANAVASRFEYGDFYDCWQYEMADGTVFEYCESNEYGIPYSIEKLPA